MSPLPDGVSPPLPVHPELRVTTLPNGFTCWMLPHSRPPGAAALSLMVGTGSLNEEEAERGVSHFIEHLAFQATEHFPPGALLEFFESLGTRLGRHHNAFTGLEHTCFSLSLPGANEAILDRALLCLADFAYRISWTPEAVETERRVILEEMRAHRGVATRLNDQILALLLPGSRVSERHPLGVHEAVRNIETSRLRAYYKRWYRPDNAIVVAVGDVDPDRVTNLLSRHFADWPAVAETARPADPGIRPLAETRAAVVTDPEVKESQLMHLVVRPFGRARTVADYRAQLVDDMAAWLLNRRLGALIQAGEAPFRDAQVSIAPVIDRWIIAGAKVAGSVPLVEAMLASLVSEIHRVRVHGFPESEVEVARRHLLSLAEQAVLEEPNRSSESLLNELSRAAGERQPPMSKEQDRAVVESVAAKIAPEEILAAFSTLFDSAARLVVAAVPDRKDAPQPEPATLLEIVRERERAAVAPPSSPVLPVHPFGPIAAPGSIRDESEDADLGVRSLTLANGVRLHIRAMDYRKNRVFLRLTLAGGRLRETEADIGLTAAAALGFSQPASDDLSSIQICDLMTGKGVELDSVVEEDDVALALSGDPRDLEHGLGLVHLLLTRPRVEESALRRWQSRMEQYGSTERLSLEVRLSQESLRLVSGNDPRLRLITHDEAMGITTARAQRWLRDVVLPAPIEMAIVGDIDRDRALDIALRFVGSLPGRPRRDPSLDERRRLRVGTGPLESRVTVETVEPRGAVFSGWRAAPWSEARERELLQVAEQILAGRLHQEIREKRGMTYTAFCTYSPSRAYPEASLLSVAFYTPPDRAQEAVAASRDLVETLAERGPTDIEIEAVRRQFTDLVKRAQRDPKYWCRVLSDLEYRGTRWGELKRLEDRVAAFSGEGMQAVLKKYVTEDRRIVVVCVPAGISPPSR